MMRDDECDPIDLEADDAAFETAAETPAETLEDLREKARLVLAGDPFSLKGDCRLDFRLFRRVMQDIERVVA